MRMTVDTFRKEIERLITEAKKRGESYIDIKSGEVHRSVGGYPGKNHNMPSCCQAMYSLKKPSDEIIYSPPKGKGATLKIRYYL
ncbi:5-methylcytosine-specific restriction protein A [Ruminiclostridium sufflavum DSM 19573]|uniref:5-methylcytosine-specific restriction protein A n=2 Tax=Ruminiclostridium TaxID=1508657 RepID=A0A318XJS3_9FIRM|nr:5-methylcytosine-specific restriction protein A [Ruminiclostridium sufflavum DSM 19573]